MRHLLVVLLAGFGTAGCATYGRGHDLESRQPPRLGEPGPKAEDSATENAYQEVLDRYSQRAEVYSDVLSGVDTRMFTAVTYQSGAFREARARRFAAFRGMPAAEVDKLLVQEKEELEQYDEFFLGVHVTNYHWEDFDRSNSIWRIALVSDSGELSPVNVARIGRSDLNMRALYPYMDDFWNAYRVRFPKGSKGSQLLLRIASSLGKAELTFPVP